MDDILGLSTQYTQGLSTDALNQQRLLSVQQKVKSKETPEELQKAAKDFESVFVKQFLDLMDKTIQRGEMFHGGHAEETFRGFINEEIAKQWSTSPNGSGLGLADSIYKQMLSAVEAEHKTENEKAKTPQTQDAEKSQGKSLLEQKQLEAYKQ